MDKISTLIITKNEEDVIGDCIKSVMDFSSEIIVVDGGSVDKTSEVAEKAGAKVVNNPFKNFADQRDFAASCASTPWIFYLDSDERATPEFAKELKSKIKELKENSDIAGFWIRRKTFFYGMDWHSTDRVQRVFQRSKLIAWHGIVHETPKVDGRLETINEPILHYTHRNFEQMVEKTNEWSEYEADLRLKSNHPKMNLIRFIRVIATGFFDSYFRTGGWKNGTPGIIEAMYQGFSMFITYAKLWEKQSKYKG